MKIMNEWSTTVQLFMFDERKFKSFLKTNPFHESGNKVRNTKFKITKFEITKFEITKLEITKFEITKFETAKFEIT